MRLSTSWLVILVCLMSLLSPGRARAQEAERPPVWPGREWATATPESQGLTAAALDAVAAYAQKSGGGSGCIIRHGYLVKEWGDPKRLADIKSATKGSVGATLLGLAVDRRLVRLDEPAVTHDPRIGTDARTTPATGSPRSRSATWPR